MKAAPFWKSITVRVFAALVGVSFVCIAVSVLSVVLLTARQSLGNAPLGVPVLVRETLLLALLGLALSLVLGLVVSRAITRPLVHLLKGTRTISRGNLDYRISIHGGGEVGGLADSFNAMVESLQARTEQLVESERRYRLMTERVNDIIFTLDEKGMVTYLSARLQAITGNQPAQCTGTFVVDRLPAHEQEGARAVLQELLQGGQRVDREIQFELFARDGRKMIMEAHLTAETGPGGKRQVYGVARDISERARLLEQLTQAQKMDAVGRLAGGVAHDFNNLLTAIIGYCDYSLLTLDDSRTLTRNLEEIKKAGNRAAALTQQLLAFSRRQVMRPRILDLNRLITTLEKLLKRLLREDISLEMRLGPELGNIMADPGQIEQVIMNLCINSRDAMPRGGRIVVETTNVFLDSFRRENRFTVTQGDYVRLRITDTGSGMDKEIKSHLFEPFFTTKEVGRGAGLGLSTVYGIVKQTGGYIWAESEPDKGTAFDVFFPRAPVGAEAPGDAAGAEVRGGRETILLVEDDAMVRILVCNVLGGYGYIVHEADDAEHAEDIMKAKGAEIDLVIADVVLPGMSGKDLVEHLVAAHPGVPALYISGYPQEVTDDKGAPCLGIPLLRKPFSPEALLLSVREILDASTHA